MVGLDQFHNHIGCTAIGKTTLLLGGRQLLSLGFFGAEHLDKQGLRVGLGCFASYLICTAINCFGVETDDHAA